MKCRYFVFLAILFLMVIYVEGVYAKDIIYIEDYYFKGVVDEDITMLRMSGIRFYFFDESAYEIYRQNGKIIQNVDNYIQRINLCLGNQKIRILEWGTKIQGAVISNDLHYLEVDLYIQLEPILDEKITQIEVITKDGQSYYGNVDIEFKYAHHLPPKGLELQSELGYPYFKEGDIKDFELKYRSEFWRKGELRQYHKLWQVRVHNVSKDNIIIEKMIFPYSSGYMMVIYKESSPDVPETLLLENERDIDTLIEPGDVANISILKKKDEKTLQFVHGDFAPILIYSSGADMYRVNDLYNLVIKSYGGRF